MSGLYALRSAGFTVGFGGAVYAYYECIFKRITAGCEDGLERIRRGQESLSDVAADLLNEKRQLQRR